MRGARKEESGQRQTVPIAQPSYSPQGEPEANGLGVRRIVCEVDSEPDTEATEGVGGVRLDKLIHLLSEQNTLNTMNQTKVAGTLQRLASSQG